MNIAVETLGKDIISTFVFKGYIGALNAGGNVEKISLPKVSIERSKMVNGNYMPIGSCQYMRYFFDLYDIETPKPISMPEQLKKFSGRNFYVVADKSEIVDYPVFVKPYEDVKVFTGFVARSAKDWELYPELLEWSGTILCCDPIESELVAEYRCFVHNGKIVNISYYDGTDPTIFPNIYTIMQCIHLYDDAPVAYTMDVGVDSYGWTHLIECNDMWAIGAYGINEDDYFEMLKDRWNEILTENKI